MSDSEYKFINFSSNQSIRVDKKFFDSSKLITEILCNETECHLPDEYYNENVISFLNELIIKCGLYDADLYLFNGFIIKSELFDADLLILTKTLVLMDFLDIELHKIPLVEKVSELLYKNNINNVRGNIDEKFADNYKLVTLLWNKTKNKKIFFKLPKLNYINLELDLTENKNITQDDLNSVPKNLRNGIIKIKTTHREDIIDVNMFTKLEELYASVRCGIDQNGIHRLTNLRILDVGFNTKIKNVNHLKKLEELNACYDCGIDQYGIRKLTNLRILDVNDNNKITNVNHLTQLEELDVSGYGYGCGIDQNGIQQLIKLRKLNAFDNTKIKDVNHLTQLEVLSAPFGCGIDQNGIQQLTNLRILNVNWNTKIKNVNHLTQLEELDASGYGCGIDQNGIQQLTNLRILNAGDNKKITKR
jgi:hypothetical protein